MNPDKLQRKVIMDTIHAPKTTKWGMKAWALGDSTNGYMYIWKLYTGKKTKNTVEKGFISTSSRSRTTMRST